MKLKIGWLRVLCIAGVVNLSLLAPAESKHTESSRAEIIWDTWGVPHIFAHDEASAFRALGWAQMHNDSGVLLRLIAQGRGRGAEYYGTAYLSTDRTVRTLGLYEKARTWYLQQDPQFRRDLDAFAGGINEYAKEHPEKLDEVSKSILPVDGVDILAHTTRVLENFMSRVSSHAGGGCPIGGEIQQGSRGSNGWAIGPSRSADGHAMLLANPHLPWSTGEFTFFEAQISSPGYEAYGAALLGFPVLNIAFNDTHGWTHTVNPIRACDTYALVTRYGGYELDGHLYPFHIKEETLKVKQNNGDEKDLSLEIRQSLLGPVVERDGKFFAVRVAGLQAGSYAGALREWWDMGRAKSFAQFQAALREMQLPMFNVVYADRDGNIELLYNGLTPIRKNDAASRPGVLPGSSSVFVWNRFYDYKDLPKAINPSSGWVQNSNSVPWFMTEPFLNPAEYPKDIAPRGAPSFREQRGIRMLQQDPKITYGQLLADQNSARSELADRVMNDLLAATKRSDNHLARQAAMVLEKWDHTMNADSAGSVLFYQWAQMMGDTFFSQPFSVQHPLDTPRGLKDPNSAVTALIAAAERVEQRYGTLNVSWGSVFRLRRGKFDFPGSGGPSGLGCFDVIDYEPVGDGNFESMGGDSFMAEVEFSSPQKARILLTYGNSTDSSSPHYGDQLGLFAQKRWREPWRTRIELAQHTAEHTFLEGNSTN